EYDHIPPNKKCMALLLAEEQFLKIKQVMREEQNQPEVMQELLLKLMDDLQSLKGSQQEKKETAAQSSIPYWNFSMIDNEEARDNFLKDVCTFLRKFSRIYFGVTPKVILIAWERYGKIKDALMDKKYQQEDIQELMNNDDNEYTIIWRSKAITLDLPIEEPDNSLNIGDEHLDTISATESDEVIKSSVENLVPIASEFEGMSDDTSDVLNCNNNCVNVESDFVESLINRDTSIVYSSKIDPILEEFAGELAHIAQIPPGIVEADFDPNDDTLSDDDDFEDIEYVSFEEVNDVEQEEKEFDLEDIFQIQDVILREKLLNVHRLISNIESLKDKPTLDRVLESLSPFPIPVVDSDSFLVEVRYFSLYLDNFFTRFEEPFSVHTEEMIDPTISEASRVRVKGNQFDGITKTDPHKHIHEFLGIYDMFIYRDTKNEAVRLMMFRLSLTGEAKTWLDELNKGTIKTWDELRTSFISRFFPPALFDRLLGEIRAFSQHENESLTDAWLRMKEMLQNCHGHNLSKGNIIKIFYHGLSEITQEVLNAAAGGIFLYKTPNQAYQLLEEKVLLKLDWAKNQKTKSSLKKTISFADEGSSNSDTDKIMARMDAMTLKMDAQRSGKSYNPPLNPNDQQNDSETPINIDSDDEDEEPKPQPKTQNQKPVKETLLPKPYKPKIPSAMIQNKVPPKLGDPGSFLIPCNFNKTFSCNALADLAENMLVEVGKLTFLADFVILEMEEDSKVPLDKYGYFKNHMKTVKNGQARTQERKSEQKPEAKARKSQIYSQL
ncbi:reverse transcriptase domain-containing protein, partial [Tanacetum coccineum]